MKTIKEIADELGVDKQKVYRYIKQHCISEAHHEAHHDVLQRNGVKYYDETAEALIKQGLLAKSASSEALHEVHHEAHQNHINEAVGDTVDVVRDALISMLQGELESKNQQLAVKDKQIDDLNARLAEVSAALVAAQQTAQAAQALHAGTIQQQLIAGETDVETEDLVSASQKRKKGFLKGIFGGW